MQSHHRCGATRQTGAAHRMQFEVAQVTCIMCIYEEKTPTTYTGSIPSALPGMEGDLRSLLDGRPRRFLVGQIVAVQK